MIRESVTPQIPVHHVAPTVSESSPDPESVARETQTHTEGLDPNTFVECMGEKYRVADRVGLMPLMKFAYAASKGIDSTDMAGLSAMYEMLRDCIHEEDWERFQEDMVNKKGFVDEFLPLIQQAIEVISARPTMQRSDSSTSSETNTEGSTERSFPGLVPVQDLAG